MRRRGGRRRAVRRRNYAGKRRFGSKRVALPRLVSKKVHWFKETCQISSLSANAGTFGTGIITYKFNDLNNSGPYKSLFDMYKLTGVKIKIVPKFNSSDPTTVANANTQAGTLPMLYIAENRDPYVPAPASVADILNDDGVKIIRLTRPINLYLKSPKVQLLTDGGAQIPLQFNVGTQPWLTSGGNAQTVDQSNLEHFGHRWVLENGVGHFDVVLDVYATYYFCMKEQD